MKRNLSLYEQKTKNNADKYVLFSGFYLNPHHSTVRGTSPNGAYLQPYSHPPPAHQPLPAHFNTATHVAMRPGKFAVIKSQILLCDHVSLFRLSCIYCCTTR